MTIWEFRRLVRKRRLAIQQGCCPLGAAMDGRPRNPTPIGAHDALGLPYGYTLGVVGGFDASTPQTDLPESDEFDRGERYGRRLRSVRKLRGWA